MKTFEQLTDQQKTIAIDKATDALLTAIVEGAIRFDDERNGNDLQARIDGAWARAERLRTPWFAGEIIMEVAGDDIRGMAECDAEDALYAEPDEFVVHGVAG